MRLNALAALAAAGRSASSPRAPCAVALSRMRGERIELREGVVVVNDCYNANPMSMRAALDDLAETAPGRGVAVLGDMLELGRRRARLPRASSASQARAAGVERARHRRRPRRHRARAASAATGCTGGRRRRLRPSCLPGCCEPDDTVLVKGSRGVGLEVVAEALELPREANG